MDALDILSMTMPGIGSLTTAQLKRSLRSDPFMGEGMSFRRRGECRVWEGLSESGHPDRPTGVSLPVPFEGSSWEKRRVLFLAFLV